MDALKVEGTALQLQTQQQWTHSPSPHNPSGMNKTNRCIIRFLEGKRSSPSSVTKMITLRYPTSLKSALPLEGGWNIVTTLSAPSSQSVIERSRMGKSWATELNLVRVYLPIHRTLLHVEWKNIFYFHPTMHPHHHSEHNDVGNCRMRSIHPGGSIYQIICHHYRAYRGGSSEIKHS